MQEVKLIDLAVTKPEKFYVLPENMVRMLRYTLYTLEENVKFSDVLSEEALDNITSFRTQTHEAALLYDKTKQEQENGKKEIPEAV